MSLLMVNHGPEAVLILTDTLATTVGGAPYLYVTKCVAVPHLEMVIAGTGTAQVTSQWWAIVLERMLCQDIEMLDRHAPNELRQIWAELDGRPAHLTSTVYHFGFSPDRAVYVGYAYRSTNDFASEQLEPGFRLKPHPAGPFEPADNLEDMVALANRVRREQDELLLTERINIGGELVLTGLINRTITTVKVHRWDDHEPMWQKMNEALGR